MNIVNVKHFIIIIKKWLSIQWKAFITGSPQLKYFIYTTMHKKIIKIKNKINLYYYNPYYVIILLL